MDELQMIREAYGEPEPPTLREMTEARAAVFGTPPRTRVRFGWRLKAGVGLVAVGAATAVAIAAVGSGSPAPPATPAGTDLGERAVLAAAEKAAVQPTGKYWHSDMVDGQSYIIRAKTGTYAITAGGTEVFNWTGLKPGMGEGSFDRDLPAHPASARDEALWKKAGSPSTFRVWSNGRFSTYTAEAATWRPEGRDADGDPGGGGKFYGGLGRSSFEDLQDLPSDPSELAEKFFSRSAIERVPREQWERLHGKGNMDEVVPAMQMRRAMAMLRGPLPPKVRGGLMRALAAQPGIHAAGRVTDPLGRTGVALATGERSVTSTAASAASGTPKAEQGTYRYRKVIVFDEGTGALLSLQDQLTTPGGPYAGMKPGFVIGYGAQRSSGWSDARPKPPAEPPF
ncbi:hypothetical protein ABZ806_34020 [Spirillospora sp. NPDC047418]